MTDDGDKYRTDLIIRPVRDIVTQKMFKQCTIQLPNGGIQIYIPNNEPIIKLANVIRGYSDVISSQVNMAKKQIESAIAASPKEELRGTSAQGWQEKLDEQEDETFVHEGWIEGPAADQYCYMKDTEPSHNHLRGSFRAFQKTIAPLCMQSSYCSFTLMLALAAPMLKYANLSEGVVFHLHGDSTTGKTVSAQAGESISRCPKSLSGWSHSARSLEEVAAKCRDQLLVLNAAEKGRSRDKADILHVLTHEVAEGTGKERSKAVHEWLPNLKSRSLVLSTGNESGAVMARALKLEWNRQDEARFVSIPVPAAVDGGVLDRPNEPMSQEGARQLIERIAAEVSGNYGVVLPRWVKRVSRHREAIPGLIDRFVSKAGIVDPYQVRIARKFGLVYAAGVIASKNQFMPWTEEFVFDTIYLLMKRSLETIIEDLSHPKILQALDRAVREKGEVPKAK